MLRKTALLVGVFAAITGGITPAQDNIQQDINSLRQEVASLRRKLESPKARSGDKGFMSLLGEKINLRGRLEFEFYSVEGDEVAGYTRPGYAAGGKISGTDFRMDCLVLGADVDFIEDVYLRTELELRGGSEDKAQAANDWEISMNEAFFGFDNILLHLADLEDPLHTSIRFGAMRPWQYHLFPRLTESYGLPQTMFYRDYRVGLQIGGKTDWGFFYHLSLDDGNDMTIMHAGDAHTGYAQILADDEDNDTAGNHKDVELGIGWQDNFDNNFGFRFGTWYRWGKLSHNDRVFLDSTYQTQLDLANLDGSHKKRRFGTIGAVDYSSDFGTFKLQAEYHDARDANLKRVAYSFQPSFKLLFDGTMYQDRKFFSGMELLYRFSGMKYYGGATTRHTVPDAALAGADMKIHTFAAILDVTYNVAFIAEYNMIDEDTISSISNDEFLIHLRVNF